ncbi:hypothetical protein ACLB90_01645 [Stenotrophomonas sp. LGBM10]|uniref:hypothetical protein n=1 Tax=Stenotrophomonas sp. LGBM10 TaxID=3390038 RepID=UPI00398AC62F
MQKYREVSQEDTWGCAAACVASLMAVPYARAKRWLEKEKGKPVGARPQGFEIDEIANALFKQGVKVVADWHPPSPPPEGSIVCVHSPVRYRDYHYLLKVPGGYMDPWFDLKKGVMEGKLRASLPRGTKIFVALIPCQSPPPH